MKISKEVTEKKKNKKAGKEKEQAALAPMLFQVAYAIRRKAGGSDAQYRILRILRKDGMTSQRDLQERLGIRSGSLSETTGKMEEKGWIRRTKSKEDRRKLLLGITLKGEEVLNTLQEKDEESMFAVLSDKERKQLRKILTRLVRNTEETGVQE